MHTKQMLFRSQTRMDAMKIAAHVSMSGELFPIYSWSLLLDLNSGPYFIATFILTKN